MSGKMELLPCLCEQQGRDTDSGREHPMNKFGIRRPTSTAPLFMQSSKHPRQVPNSQLLYLPKCPPTLTFWSDNLSGIPSFHPITSLSLLRKTFVFLCFFERWLPRNEDSTVQNDKKKGEVSNRVGLLVGNFDSNTSHQDGFKSVNACLSSVHAK